MNVCWMLHSVCIDHESRCLFCLLFGRFNSHQILALGRLQNLEKQHVSFFSLWFLSIKCAWQFGFSTSIVWMYVGCSILSALTMNPDAFSACCLAGSIVIRYLHWVGCKIWRSSMFYFLVCGFYALNVPGSLEVFVLFAHCIFVSQLEEVEVIWE